ncbi:MAG: AMP-binding protein, partial [Bryobacteraceae bacterium]
MPGRNIFTTLEETAAQHGDAVALYQPAGAKAKGEYRTYSWNEWLAASREIALGLRALGLAKGDIVCILSETRAE